MSDLFFIHKKRSVKGKTKLCKIFYFLTIPHFLRFLKVKNTGVPFISITNMR